MATNTVFLPGKSHGQSSLLGYSPWGCKELDTTEQLHYLSICEGVLESFITILHCFKMVGLIVFVISLPPLGQAK